MKRAFAALLTTVLAVLLTGCGAQPSQAKLTPDALLSKARAYISAHQDVSLSGRIAQSGAETSIDLAYSGADSVGTITLAGATIRLETIDGTTYFKPSKAFWSQQLPAGQADLVTKLIDDRWIIADPKNADFGQLIQIAKRSFLTDEVLTPTDKPTKGKVTTVSGTKAIPLNLKSGSLFLAESDARPLQVKGLGNGGAGTATFSYAKVSIPAAPAADEQVDLAKLMATK